MSEFITWEVEELQPWGERDYLIIDTPSPILVEGDYFSFRLYSSYDTAGMASDAIDATIYSLTANSGDFILSESTYSDINRSSANNTIFGRYSEKVALVIDTIEIDFRNVDFRGTSIVSAYHIAQLRSEAVTAVPEPNLLLVLGVIYVYLFSRRRKETPISC